MNPADFTSRPVLLDRSFASATPKVYARGMEVEPPSPLVRSSAVLPAFDDGRAVEFQRARNACEVEASPDYTRSPDTSPAFRAPPGGVRPKPNSSVLPGENYEPLFTRFVDSFQSPDAPTLAFQTARRWRAIDVYATLPRLYFASAGAYLRVLVWGVNEVTGGRTVVGGGLAGGDPVGLDATRRVALAIGPLPQRFEVTVSLAGGLQTADDPWMLSAVATDEAAEADGGGALLVGAGGATLPGVIDTSQALPGNTALPSWRLAVYSLTVSNTTVGQRWIQLHDQANPALCVGAIPQVSVGVPAGGTVALDARQLAGYRYARNGLIAFPSTQGGVGAAAAGDLVYSAVLR